LAKIPSLSAQFIAINSAISNPLQAADFAASAGAALSLDACFNARLWDR
jgi:hypothetical protein